MTTHSSKILVLMAFALGVRHGFDLDHLATIDAITRTVKENARLSKCVGFLFSLGHGVVVILMSLVISTGMVQTPAPLWLAVLGSWISTVFLLVFGGITFWQVLSDSTHSPAGLPIGLRVFVFRKLLGENYNPFLIMLIGALFAFSFDTFTQVALFSLSMSVVAGVFFSVILGMVFMCGMITSDGLNGFLVSALIQRAEKQSRIISRVIGFSIACFSVILGLMGVGAQGLF